MAVANEPHRDISSELLSAISSAHIHQRSV